MVIVLPHVCHQLFNLPRFVSSFLGALFAQHRVRISISLGAVVYHGCSITGMSYSRPHDAVGTSLQLRRTLAQPKECLGCLQIS
jgi:hypothetical protein